MEAFVDQIFNILINPPGNLAYYVILAFTVVGALQSSLNHWRQTGFPQGNRMVAGLTLLLVFQLGQFAAAGLAWQGLINPGIWLPPVDRLVVILSVICIVWLWLVPEPTRLGDFAFGLVFFLGLVFFGLSLYWWSIQPFDTFFNTFWMDWGACLFGLVVLGIGIIGLLIRRPNGWGIGTTMLGLLFAGLLIQFLYPQFNSNYAAPIRLAQLMAFPWLFALPQRFPIPAIVTTKIQSPAVAERRRYTTDIRAIEDLLGLLGKQVGEEYYSVVARTLSQIMLADYCLLVSPPGLDDTMTVVGGYNLIEEKRLDGFSLNGQSIPMVASAIKRGKSLRLPSSSTSPDLQSLAKGLRMSRVGHLLAAPMMGADQSPFLGVVLLSPFSNRGWSREDQDVLFRLSEYITKVYQRSLTDSALEAAKQAEDSAEQKDAEEEQVSQQAYDDLQANLRLALEQVADLRAEIDRSDPTKLNPPTTPAGDPILSFDEAILEIPELLELREEEPQIEVPIGSEEQFKSLLNELRQPISSINGYTDLLLGDSIGELDGLQRKFLERIRASVERLGGLTDDLIQATAMAESRTKLNPETARMGYLIDSAVAIIKDEALDKNIQLEMNIPERIPELKVDQEEIKKVFTSLLKCAIASTFEDGKISLKVSVESRDHEPGYILVQISDTSDGIPAQDLPRVFSSVFKAEQSSFDPASGTEIDLATVKAMVEAHGGRIWVDSIVGKGTTFSTLLPFEAELGSE